MICFCKTDTMSQCVARSTKEQRQCSFWDKSSVADRCMNFLEEMDNHCWSVDAQAFGREHGVVIPDNIPDEVEISLDEETPTSERNCVNCILYACPHITHENSMAQSRGGLTIEDMANIAAKCAEYDDEETMQRKINQSLRRISP